MLDHLPFDLRLNTDLFNHLKQSSENSSGLDKASGLSNRYCTVCNTFAIFSDFCNQTGIQAGCYRNVSRISVRKGTISPYWSKLLFNNITKTVVD